MSIFGDFFKRLADIISGESKSQNTRFRMRRLHFEVLENRELLSANPIDGSTFDWSWGENSESPPVIYLPQIDVYAINSSGCAPFTPVDFLLSDNIQVKDNDSLGGDINTGGSGAASQIQIDGTSNLNCSNTGIIATYTIDNNFIGNDLISYDIQEIDQESNSTVTVASGFIAVEVLPDNVGGGEQIELPAGFNIDVTSSSFGQISIGGSGSQVGVSGEFTPPTNDTYTASVSLSADSVARAFSGVTGTGSETLDIKISSDFFANGDWFYAETANFSYSISTDTGIFWGGYSYSLFAGSIGGNYHHTFILNGTDYFFITENITDQQSSNVTNSYTSQVIGGTVNTTYIQYSDASNPITSTEIHNTAAASHNISYGTYQYTVSGGTVDGTFTKTGESQSSSHQKIINVTENNQTTATGNFAITSKDETKYIYAAGGDYLIEVTTEESEDFTLNTGTITESGFTIDTSNYSINGVLDSSGEWTNNGSATLTHEYESNFYNYDKFKFLITDSDANGNWTDKGRYITETETQQWGELTTTNSLELNEQSGESEWKTVSGSGSNDITTYDFTDNKVKRTYDQTGSADGKTWSVSGTTKQRDKTEYETEKQVVSLWNNSLESWVYTGEGTGNGSNFSKLKLDESGTYESTMTQDNIEFSITDGTISRSSLDKSETTFTTESELVDGVWVDSGTGSVTGISKSQSEYSGEGTFDLTIDDTRITDESNVMTGDVEESGNEKYKSTWTSETELQDGEWVTVNGSGETTSKGKILFTFDGEVDTTEQYTEDNTEYDLDTTRKLSGKEKNKWDTTATNAVIDGQWETTAGSGTSDSLSLQENSIDSSGSYTTSVSGESGFEIDGDIDLGESNSEKITSTNTLSWNSSTDEWVMSSIIDFKIQTENYCDKTSSSGSFWENEPSTTVMAGCSLSDGSTGTLVTQSSGSLTGDLTEEIHTTYLYKADYSISVDTEDNETLLDGGTTKTKWHQDSTTTWDGNGTFTRGLTYSNTDGDTLNVTTVSGTTKIKDKTTTVEYNETVKEESADGEWKLEDGNYKNVIKENGTTKVKTDTTSTNYLSSGTESTTISITDKIKTKTKEVYKGEVVEDETEVADKVWEYSATLTDNSSGKYVYEETVEEAAYSREIDGGTVSGTITISISNTDKYGADDIQYQLEGEGESAEWKLVSGSRWTEHSISETETCDGSGSYSTTDANGVSLNGTISESFSYETTSTNAKVTEIYNATTEEWTKSSGQGSITYSETTSFSDSATGTFEVENGTGTINERKITDNYSYTATEYLSSGNIYYDQTTTSTYKYDAEQTTNTEQTADGTITGTKKQWTKNEIDSEEVLGWAEYYDGTFEITEGSRDSSFSYESGVSFTMDSNGAGSTNFTEYYYETQIASESDDLGETLDVDLANDYHSALGDGEELLNSWLDAFWITTGGSITSTESYELDWTKSKDESDVTRTIWGHNFVGNNDWSEEYEVERTLTITETFSDGSAEDIAAGIVAGVTGSGTETINIIVTTISSPMNLTHTTIPPAQKTQVTNLIRIKP